MSEKNTKATVHFAGNDFFVGVTSSGHAQAIETNSERASAATPMELLLIALGSCTAVDVISILKKKRQQKNRPQRKLSLRKRRKKKK